MCKIWQVHRRGYGILLLHALRVRVCQPLSNFGPIARQSELWRSAAERAKQSAPRQSAADMIRPVRPATRLPRARRHRAAAVATAVALRCFCRRPAPSRRPIRRSRGLVCEGPPRWLGRGPGRFIYTESYPGRTPRRVTACRARTVWACLATEQACENRGGAGWQATRSDRQRPARRPAVRCWPCVAVCAAVQSAPRRRFRGSPPRPKPLRAIALLRRISR